MKRFSLATVTDRPALFAHGTLFLSVMAEGAFGRSNPVAAMTSKGVFLAFLALGAAFCAGRASVSGAVVQQQGAFSARAFKLTPLKLRGGPADSNTLLAANSSSGRVGLLWNGCEIAPSGSVGAAEFRSAWEWGAAAYTDEVRANGYYFTTAAAGDGSLDPVSWVAEGSRDGTAWFPVGASERRLRFDGHSSWYPGLAFPTTVARGVRVDFDLRPGWQWIVQSVVTFALGSVCFLASLALALSGCQGCVKWAFIFHYGVTSLLFAVAAAGHSWGGEVRASCAISLLIPEHVLVAVGLAFFERHIIGGLALYGLAFFASRATTARLCYEARWETELWESLPSQGSVALLFALAATTSRLAALWRARRLVAGDRAKYDAVWAGLMRQADAMLWVPALEAEVARIAERLPAAAPRQVSIERIVPSGVCSDRFPSMTRLLQRYRVHPLLHANVNEPAMSGTPVTSLDQLYCQASCLDPVLRSKVRAWARRTGGGFMAMQSFSTPTVYVKLAGATADAGAMIKWGEVKSVQRAIEKMYRSYGQV
jgi:hypothetical protein